MLRHRSKPRVALRFMELISGRLRDVEARMENVAFKSVPARLADTLIQLAAEAGGKIEGVSHQDLADIVGTYRETATRVLNEFQRILLLLQLSSNGIGLLHRTRNSTKTASFRILYGRRQRRDYARGSYPLVGRQGDFCPHYWQLLPKRVVSDQRSLGCHEGCHD